MTPRLVVTTTTRPRGREFDRARQVADRCGVAFVPRRGSLAAVLDEADVTIAYAVGRARDEIVSAEQRLFVHPGLTVSRLRHGRAHPLVRAVDPEGAVRSVFDGTLGLAGDALHLAGALEVPVTGAEASPAVFSLLEEGLPRLARQEGEVGAAAARIEPVLGRAATVLAAAPADRWGVVVLDPMFDEPRAAPPGYALFREVAVHDPLDERTLAEALRVARRVVVKGPRGEPPAGLAPGDARPVEGRAVTWWVLERGARALP